MRTILLSLLALSMVGCQKEALVVPVPSEIAISQSKLSARSRPQHVNTLSYNLFDVYIPETITVTAERSTTVKGARLLHIFTNHVLMPGVSSITMSMNVDGYDGKAASFAFGSTGAFNTQDNFSTTNARFSIPAWFYPDSREGDFTITDVQKTSDGDVITGTFWITFGAPLFSSEYPMTDGHFSLLVPKH